MKKTLLLFGFILISSYVFAQNPCSLRIILRYEDYLRQVKENSDNELVEIKKVIPTIRLDITYATTKNIINQKVYTMAKAFGRKPVVEALKKIQAELSQKGLGLKIYDGYRPYGVTCMFYAVLHDTTFVAAPWRGSKHNRGCAMDLTLVDLKTGQELPMPGKYDETSERSFQSYMGGTAAQRANRALLLEIMESNGFQRNSFEWWHFDFIGWERFDINDITFEKLSGKSK